MPGGGESSNQGSSQSQGSGSSYSQSASVSMPYNLQNAAFQALAPSTANSLQSITNMLSGGAGSNSLLASFLAPYGGSMVAPVTGAQNATLGNIANAEGGNYNFDPSLAAVMAQLQGEATNPTGFATNVANAGTGANSAVGAGQALASGLAGPGSPNVGLGQFASNLATGGAIQQVIQQAEQPITTAFNTQTVPGLQGSLAGAGQRATGGGSSAFANAFGNAQAQEEAALGSTAAGITNNAFNEGVNAYTGAYNAGASNYTGLYGTGLNLAGNAAGQFSSLGSNELNQLLSSLNAQALPQLTEQLGINNALSTYNNSVGSILQALGLQVQGEQPVIGYGSESLSNSASFTNEESSGQQSGSSFNFSLPGLL